MPLKCSYSKTSIWYAILNYTWSTWILF